MEPEILKAILEVEAENEGKISEVFKGLSDKGAEAVTGALRLISAYKDELPKDVMVGLTDLAGYEVVKAKNPFLTDDEKKKEAEAKAKAEAAAKAKKEKDKKKDDSGFPFPMAKALGGMSDELREQMEPVFKAMEAARTEEIAKAEEDVRKANDRTEEIAKTLATERDLRQTKEWIAKAETDLSHYPGKSSEELGNMLKNLHDHDPKVAEEQFESMKIASEAIKKSELFTSAGVAGGGSAIAGSAEEKIERMAQQYVAKGSDGMTIEQARVAVQDQHPELYDDYLNEHPEQTGAKR